MITEKLNKNQQEAVDHKGGPLLIAAGAGSGKTKTLTNRIVSLLKSGVPAKKILAITFTNKAASEMKFRIERDCQAQNIDTKGLTVSTFHSLGARLLRVEAKHLGRSSQFTIFDDGDSLSVIRKIIKELHLDKEDYKPRLIRYYISKIKSELVSSNDDEMMTRAYEIYEKTLKKCNAFDFDDLIEKLVILLRDNPNILSKYQNRYQHLLVDEFQDTNVTQYLLIKLLAKKHNNLSVVGDDAQSIYGWRHADFRNFLNFEKDWPNAKVVLLEENYRSSANIINAANELIKHNKFQKEKALWTQNPAGNKISVTTSQSEEEEAGWITAKVMELRSTNNNSAEIAILYRTNAQSRAIEQALIYEQVPYQVFGGIRFYERKEIKDLLAGLRFAFNPNDEVSFERLQKTFGKRRSRVLIENLPRLANELTLPQLIDSFLNNSNYINYLESHYKNYKDRIENVQELVNFASSFEGQGLAAFLEAVSLVQSQDKPDGINGVKLMTIHLSKGLEFNNVFVCGCSEGLLPHERSIGSPEELEEERRLMYVAMTRARKNLFLTLNSIPSRFLYELPEELLTFKGLGQEKSSLPDEDEMYIEY